MFTKDNGTFKVQWICENIKRRKNNQAIGTNLLNRISQNICAKQKYLPTHFLELSEMTLKLKIVGEEKKPWYRCRWPNIICQCFCVRH